MGVLALWYRVSIIMRDFVRSTELCSGYVAQSTHWFNYQITAYTQGKDPALSLRPH